MNKLFLLVNIIAISASVTAMQQPDRVYDAQKTNELKALIQKNGLLAACPLSEVQRLILAGADPDATTVGSSTTMLYNSFVFRDFAEQHEEFICFLLDHAADPNKWQYESPLHNACANGQIIVVRKLLEKKAKVDAKTPKGVSPLKKAVEGGFAGIVQVLLEKGAAGDIDFLDAYGDTPRAIACDKKFEKITALFEKYQKNHTCKI